MFRLDADSVITDGDYDVITLAPDIDPDMAANVRVFGGVVYQIREDLCQANGIAFDSVRRPGGECVAMFRPRLVQNVRQSVHLRYAWDGQSIANVYEMRAIFGAG